MDDAHHSDSSGEQVGAPRQGCKPARLDPAELQARRENHHATLVVLMEQIGSLAGETLLMARDEMMSELGAKLARNGIALATGFASLITAEMVISDKLGARQ